MQTFLTSEKIALSDPTNPVWQGNGGREGVDEGATDGGKNEERCTDRQHVPCELLLRGLFAC